MSAPALSFRNCSLHFAAERIEIMLVDAVPDN